MVEKFKGTPFLEDSNKVSPIFLVGTHCVLFELGHGAVVRGLDIVREEARGELSHFTMVVEAVAAGVFFTAGVCAVAVLLVFFDVWAIVSHYVSPKTFRIFRIVFY